MPPADSTGLGAASNLETPIRDILQAIFKLSDTGVYVAITVGIMLFVVGYFAGIRENKTKMFFSILIVVIVGFFSMRIPAYIFILLSSFLKPVYALAVVYFVWTAFLLGMAISLYETWIITFKEQFGGGK